MDAINFLESKEFHRIKKLMGISDNSNTNFTLEISADDSELEGTAAGIFYKGRRVVLYIRDQAQYGERISEYKFHVVDCPTLARSRRENRYGKYVVSTKTDGKFTVKRIKNNRARESVEELHVCKNCLQKLNWHGYKSADNAGKYFIYKNFSIAEFFNIMNGDNQFFFTAVPNDNDVTARLNVYPNNWEEIARRLKKKYNYTCQECHRNFSDCKSQLHVHHKNGLKYDCSESNLEVLCFECHQKKHHHKIGGIST